MAPHWLQQRFQYWKYWSGFEQAYYKIKIEVTNQNSQQ